MTGCPLGHVTPDVSHALDLVDWADKGVLPVGGGYYDQTPAFLATLRLARAERRRIEITREARRRPG